LDFWVQQDLGSEYAPAYYPGAGQVGQAELIHLLIANNTLPPDLGGFLFASGGGICVQLLLSGVSDNVGVVK